MYHYIRSAPPIETQAQYQAFIDHLYQNYFVGFRCTTIDFALTIIFVQLQYALNAHVEQDWRESPWGYLRSYLGHMLGDESTRPKTIETVTSISSSLLKNPLATMLSW
jgi:hypothetical protein